MRHTQHWGNIVTVTDQRIAEEAVRINAELCCQITDLRSTNAILTAKLLSAEAMHSEADLCIAAYKTELSTLTAQRDGLEKVLRWILPMAKGYAALNPVGNNATLVKEARAVLADIEKEMKNG